MVLPQFVPPSKRIVCVVLVGMDDLFEDKREPMNSCKFKTILAPLQTYTRNFTQQQHMSGGYFQCQTYCMLSVMLFGFEICPTTHPYTG